MHEIRVKLLLQCRILGKFRGVNKTWICAMLPFDLKNIFLSCLKWTIYGEGWGLQNAVGSSCPSGDFSVVPKKEQFPWDNHCDYFEILSKRIKSFWFILFKLCQRNNLPKLKFWKIQFVTICGRYKLSLQKHSKKRKNFSNFRYDKQIQIQRSVN